MTGSRYTLESGQVSTNIENIEMELIPPQFGEFIQGTLCNQDQGEDGEAVAHHKEDVGEDGKDDIDHFIDYNTGCTVEEEKGSGRSLEPTQVSSGHNQQETNEITVGSPAGEPCTGCMVNNDHNIPAKDNDHNIPVKDYINQDEGRVAYSMDVGALYPSITGKHAGDAVRDEVEHTDLKFNHIDWRMANRFLAKAAVSDGEVKEWRFEEWVPKRTKTGNRRPGMLGAATTDPKWTGGVVPAKESDKMRILAKVMELAVRKVYTCNLYTFGGKYYLQSDGAPIGMDLSGELGRLVMARWDKAFDLLCHENEIKLDLNLRYVDDDNLASIPVG